MSVQVLLGPTNTGKTHRAIERMLEFESGMIGLPLRLLAREIYDRLTPRVGEQAVALVTGEEKRVPAQPRYWVCTIEALPTEREVDFVAIDEIQLVSHPERGHVFTDRLLHLRGRAETWFLGSDTVESIVRAHLPLARLRKLPRLSTLRYAGQASLRTLPRRSAVVAFSLPQVYELADLLRVRRGGAAVVLGALSPRVRNAQVALYQAGEVDFLVATDAIGMGLNLDIDHVALAARTKFDGFETRELEAAELAQIAGRAGRYLKDGSFGVLSPEPELPPSLVEQLENHRFSPLRFAYYRNSTLDDSSVPALLLSLEKKPRGFALRSAPDADDFLVLRVLSQSPEVLELARDPRRVRLLWDLCRIPNYEKRIPEHQAQRILPLYRELLARGSLPESLIEAEVARIAHYEGDIHTLMERLSAIRTWSYISQKPEWIDAAAHWRERTRAIEDRLGDVLHQRLIERFVSVRAEGRRKPSSPSSGKSAPAERAAHPFAKLAGLLAHEGETEPVAFEERLVSASFGDFALDAGGVLHFDHKRVARLLPGAGLLHPQPKLLLSDLNAGTRARVERRLLAHLKDLTVDLLAPLALPGELSAPARGLLYQLEQGLGTVARRAAAKEWAALSEAERQLLRSAEIYAGRDSFFSRPLLSPPRLSLRRALTRLVDPEVDALKPLEEVAAATGQPRLSVITLARLGFVALGKWIVRCDVLELLRSARAELSDDAELAQRVQLVLGSDAAATAQIVRALGAGKKPR